MDRRRMRILSVVAMTAGLSVAVACAPAVMAATCTLTASATANVGTALTIAGAGFPASSSIDIEIALEGATIDEFSRESDTSGAFDLQLTPEAADIGNLTLVATATGCTAQASITILDVGQTAPPTAEPEAPEGEAAGAGGGPPRTDADGLTRQPDPGSSGAAPWALAVLTLVIGLGGLFATRPTRRS